MSLCDIDIKSIVQYVSESFDSHYSNFEVARDIVGLVLVGVKLLNVNIDYLKKNNQLSLLREILRGIEKENLRVTLSGELSDQNHPQSLGATLTHPWITTDFSEALVEVVTPPSASIKQALDQLAQVTSYTAKHLSANEFLWPASMPPAIKDATCVPLADYGKTNIGRMKKIYREGLCRRYGRAMQIISGIHYNVSFSEALFETLRSSENSSQSLSDFTNDKYMGLVRNFFRHSWLLPYLFGASPACNASSVIREVDILQTDDQQTFVGKYATSLRLGDLGYQNQGADLLNIQYDSVNSYAKSLLQATRTPYADYQAIGLTDENGYRQLNDSLLQIENEYYSPIRPKQIAKSCELPSQALLNRGIAYVEVRMLDLNPLELVNLSANCCEFVELFLMYCLLSDSPQFAEHEWDECRDNIKLVASCGRKPGLELMKHNEPVDFNESAESLFDGLRAIAERLDADAGDRHYQDVLDHEFKKVMDVSLTPSAQVAEALKSSEKSYQQFCMDLGQAYQQQLVEQPVAMTEYFNQQAAQSWVEFNALEKQPQKPFHKFLRCTLGD